MTTGKNDGGQGMNVMMVFVDGVGIGAPDPARNPFARFELPTIDNLLSGSGDSHDRILRHIDANLGVDGLPQSGTGQASLLTGVNCARIAGRHFGPFPHSSTRKTIAEHNVFHQVNMLADDGRPHSAFANAYPPPFFEMVRRRGRWTVTTRCCLDSGIRIRNLDDLAGGEAVAADITGERLARAGFDVNPVSEDTAATAIVRLAGVHRFTLFEHFLTDKAGHSQSFDRALSVLQSLDRFLRAVLRAAAKSDITIVLTSDHGNLEDLSTKSHTRNPVPLVAVGPGARSFENVDDLTGVTPAIMDVLSG